jgi:hypothetical protein
VPWSPLDLKISRVPCDDWKSASNSETSCCEVQEPNNLTVHTHLGQAKALSRTQWGPLCACRRRRGCWSMIRPCNIVRSASVCNHKRFSTNVREWPGGRPARLFTRMNLHSERGWGGLFDPFSGHATPQLRCAPSLKRGFTFQNTPYRKVEQQARAARSFFKRPTFSRSQI